MRARIGIAMSLYWVGIVQLIDVIAMISAFGAIGGLPALLNALTKYTRGLWVVLGSRAVPTPVGHALCIRRELPCK
jgi:hypothetical protein